MQNEFKTRSLSNQLLLKAFRGAGMVGMLALE
jgi:predicted ATP-grasp superfamily ATP-dependent carboligase